MLVKKASRRATQSLDVWANGNLVSRTSETSVLCLCVRRRPTTWCGRRMRSRRPPRRRSERARWKWTCWRPRLPRSRPSSLHRRPAIPTPIYIRRSPRTSQVRIDKFKHQKSNYKIKKTDNSFQIVKWNTVRTIKRFHVLQVSHNMFSTATVMF